MTPSLQIRILRAPRGEDNSPPRTLNLDELLRKLRGQGGLSPTTVILKKAIKKSGKMVDYKRGVNEQDFYANIPMYSSKLTVRLTLVSENYDCKARRGRLFITYNSVL